MYFFQIMNMYEQPEERVAKLLGQLKKMAREIPADLQQRVPYELLSELASSLAQVTFKAC